MADQMDACHPSPGSCDRQQRRPCQQKARTPISSKGHAIPLNPTNRPGRPTGALQLRVLDKGTRTSRRVMGARSGILRRLCFCEERANSAAAARAVLWRLDAHRRFCSHGEQALSAAVTRAYGAVSLLRSGSGVDEFAGRPES